MSNAKLISIVVLAVLCLVVVLQNTAAVKTQILFFSFEMSQSVLLICTALLGFAIGVLTALLGVKKRRGPAQPELRA